MINYSLESDVATIHFDDGKANVVSAASAAALSEALERAEEARVVVLRGRPGKFSAGFDLKTFQSGDIDAARAQAMAGFEMLYKLTSHPRPVLAISEGHAIGMGAFLLLAADTRIGLDEPCKIGLPETAISMTMEPEMLPALAKERLAKTHFLSAVLQAKMYQPSEAVTAGFLDSTAAAGDLEAAAEAATQELLLLPTETYATNKAILKGPLLTTIANNLEAMRKDPTSIF